MIDQEATAGGGGSLELLGSRVKGVCGGSDGTGGVKDVGGGGASRGGDGKGGGSIKFLGGRGCSL